MVRVQKQFSPIQKSDPFAWFREMREQHPVYYDQETERWYVFRYKDVEHVLTDYTHFSSEWAELVRPEDQRRGISFLTMDPPRHNQLRNIVAQVFTPKSCSLLTGRIQEIVQDLLDQIKDKGSVDFVQDFSYPFPVTVIAELIGIPVSDRALYKRWADGIASGADMDEGSEERREQSMQEMSDYFSVMLRERRSRPRQDLMSSLLAAEVDGEHLTEEELIVFCVLLLIAGHETTKNLLALAIQCFDTHPGVMDRLRMQPTLMPSAVEEVLRYRAILWGMFRVAQTDILLDDQLIHAGDMVFGWIAAANRDPERFVDPERFDIERGACKHLAFGHGIHTCLGAPLTRLETTIALPMILEQLTDLHVVPGTVIDSDTITVFRRVNSLPITFKPHTTVHNLVITP
ncbi:cytochrome P450 [Dictyobacter arantiisoli]|uniref:Putative cytochrome P450 YjiB n=1 Tax=Dictyobacter arantiisoli TaxID=2014874 RepID=A0A5A5T6F5_9CHLR|nr:cytochrome P450 [Dictyobacter arantiisoli]GCF06962.1 putative cytochrome P450 YjiB [Dictyobacter arantiisoli]